MLRPVVVGLDGSRESLAAADWAAREALRRGLPLRLVHAYEGLAPDASDLPELEAPRYWARRILRGAMDRLGEQYPQVFMSATQVPRPAAEALVTAATEAELLVLGSRAFSGFGGFMAGSVALATVAHVRRPVVLVRALTTAEDEYVPDAAGRPYREVVAGVDLGCPGEEVLRFACESAALRGAPLHVVHAWQGTAQPAAERALAALMAPWREKFPALRVRETVVDGRPAQELLHASTEAGLLVVGRRTRPARLGTHTGPVAHAVMHHVRCPVAIVPHD
ncbi:universal stress protein [Streptomyces sp. 7R007]